MPSTAFAAGLCVSAPARPRRSSLGHGRMDSARSAERGTLDARGLVPGAFDRVR